MRSFTIDNYRFDVISHERVIIGEGDTAVIEECFVVECYLNNVPLPWSNDYPSIRQRENFKFVGKLSQDVYNDAGVKVGTKRGADFRSNFHRVLYRKAEAVRLGTRMGQVLTSRVETRTSVLRGTLKARSLDDAVVELTGEPLRTRTETKQR